MSLPNARDNSQRYARELVETVRAKYPNNLHSQLAFLAVMSATASPPRQNTWASRAGVPWAYIHAIRLLLPDNHHQEMNR